MIDALRGFALAGVLLMNLGAFTLVDHLDREGRAGLATASFDQWAGKILNLLVNGKAITVFSLLFGLGFAIQLGRAQALGANGIQIYTRRIFILLAIGVAHGYLLWWGDILQIYAVLALVLIPLRHLPDRALLLMGLFVAVLLPAMLTPWMDVLQARIPSDSEMDARSLDAFMSPSYAFAMKHNAAYVEWARLAMWGVFPFVFGRFLLGYWAGRKRLLHEPLANRTLLKRIFAVSISLGLGTTFYGAFDHGFPELALGPAQALMRVLKSTSSLALGIAYITGFALLFLLPACRARLCILVPVGRMALTNYLVHTAVCVPLFYGFGLGVGPRFGYAGWLVTWTVLFTGQIITSRWWLAHFHFGPAEWMWRSLTYMRPQPMQKTVPAEAAVARRTNGTGLQRSGSRGG